MVVVAFVFCLCILYFVVVVSDRLVVALFFDSTSAIIASRQQVGSGRWHSSVLNYFKIVICPIFRGIISRRSAALRARGQCLVRTGVEWDSVGALTLARPDVALSWEARGAWLVSALLSIHPVL